MHSPHPVHFSSSILMILRFTFISYVHEHKMFPVNRFNPPCQAFYTGPDIFMTMPKFAVVVCPHCKNAFIMEPGHKTVSCRSCNKRLEASRLKVFFASDDFKEAQAA